MNAAILAVALTAAISVHLPVTTSSTAAALAIDRGLFLYYAYNGGEAAAAFETAAVADPRLAMAYWGIALAAGPDLNTPMNAERFERGQNAILKAEALAGSANDAERAYIDAMALRYKGTWDDWNRDDAAYRKAMSALAGDPATTGGDGVARVLAAEALLEHGTLTWDGNHLASEDSRRALELVNAVLRDAPNDVMANHLCVHAFDEAPDRAPAADCARRLDAADVPPAAEHLAHMPAHYWIETGNYAAAIASSARALALFERLQTLTDRDSEHDRYLRHDLYSGYSAAMMLGDYAAAQTWATRMEAAYGTPFAALTALRFGRYTEAYALARDDSPSELAVRGTAALQMGRVDEAHAIATRLRKIATAGYLTQLFFGRLEFADGHFDDAARWIDRAVDAQRSAFGAELIPLVPALEARGAMALVRGDDAAAIAAFRDALAAFPNDPRALFGLARALRAQGRDVEADAVRSTFERLWTPNDTSLTPYDL